MECKCWRKHSKNYPRGVTPPKTLESLQAAWDRDQELIFEMKEELARQKQTINDLRQKAISHSSELYPAWDAKGLVCVRLICSKCGYTTRWFETPQKSGG